ncbi:MAG: hypothetical protein ACLFWD_05880 [Anaerolineales bacterium]
MHPIPALLLALGLLLLLQRQLHRHLQGLLYLITRSQQAALLIYALLFFPGVVLHEGSHWLVAKILRVPTHGFSLLPRRTQNKMIRFGYVKTGAVDPIRASLIGLAPLMAGTLAMFLLAFDHLGVGAISEVLQSGLWAAALDQMEMLLATPDILLWLYLIFAIGNTMLPSKSDRASWALAGLILAVLAGLGAAAGLAEQLGPWLASIGANIASSLASVFLLTVIMDVILLIPVLTTEALISKILGQEILYDS